MRTRPSVHATLDRNAQAVSVHVVKNGVLDVGAAQPVHAQHVDPVIRSNLLVTYACLRAKLMVADMTGQVVLLDEILNHEPQLERKIR